jgi:hypothetical protein
MTHSFRRVGIRMAAPLLLTSVALASQRPAPLPTGRELVQRHVAAIGGEAAFKSIKSMRLKGRFEISGQNITAEFEELAVRPDKLLMRADIAGVGHTEQGFDGKIAWTIDPQTGPRLLKDRERDEARADADFDGPLHLPQHVTALSTAGRVEFDGHQAFKVNVVLSTGVEQDEYFDAQSGLEIGWEARRATPLGIVPMTAFLRDYKKFGPIMQPTTLVQKALFIEQILHVTSVEYDVVPPNEFELPPAIKALVK